MFNKVYDGINEMHSALGLMSKENLSDTHKRMDIGIHHQSLDFYFAWHTAESAEVEPRREKNAINCGYFTTDALHDCN